MPLTKRTVDALSFDPSGPATQIHFANGDIPGFGLRLFPSGAKSYVLWLRTTSGQKRLHTVGKHGVVTVQQARELARTTLADASKGHDPQQARQEAREGETLKEFALVYMEKHAKKFKKSWKEDERRLNSHIIPALGNKKLKDITSEDVERLHRKIGERHPTEANRVIEVVSSMFTRATERPFSRLAKDYLNPARITAYAEASRERWVTAEELPLLWAAIDQEDSVYVRAALKLYIHTGVRKTELLESKWDHVDFTRRTLLLPVTKNGESHLVPLSAQALAELRGLPRQLGNAFIFPSEVKPGARRVNLSKPWGRVRARVWLEAHPEEAEVLRAKAVVDLQKKFSPKTPEVLEAHVLKLAAKKAGGPNGIRLHDLRRTAGSMMLDSGVTPEVIAVVLNNPSSVKVYTRLRNKVAQARAALEAHGQALETAVAKPA